MDFHSLSAYDYPLPPERIAQKPAEPRDASRLLVLHRTSGKWEHRVFTDLPEYLHSSDLLVANNTKVLKARLLGNRLFQNGEKGGKIEFVLLEEVRPRVWEGLLHASARHKAGLRFEIPTPDGKGLRAELIQSSIASPHGTVVAEFDRDPVESGAGVIPLPHYIRHEAASDDTVAYQTVYAKQPGSAAAPTAGLHFTPRILEKLRARDVTWEEITLHVGLGTFRPVKEEDIRRHLMHEERFEISTSTAENITLAQSQGKRIIAVGTTCVRTLESAWDSEAKRLRPGPGRTSLFIYPGQANPFQVVGGMVTNFHLPKSTLLMLVCTLAGRELTLAAYEDAIREKYRFFSYGDAMLIL